MTDTRYRHCHAGGASSSGREHVFQPDPDAKPLFPSSYKGGESALNAAPLHIMCSLPTQIQAVEAALHITASFL